MAERDYLATAVFCLGAVIVIVIAFVYKEELLFLLGITLAVASIVSIFVGKR
jgi:hypothetical protein